MGSNFKLVMSAALVGICLGGVALAFGIVSKNKAEELRGDFSKVQELVEKIREVEESSSGVSATAVRIRRELDSLRDGTQGALDQVSNELSRLRGDLNESIALARGLEDKVAEYSRRTEELQSEPEPVEVAGGGSDREELEEESSARTSDFVSDLEADSVSNAETEPEPEVEADEGEVYVIQGGDTLSRVASAHGVGLGRLIEANPAIDPDRLQIGQEILIPPAD